MPRQGGIFPRRLSSSLFHTADSRLSRGLHFKRALKENKTFMCDDYSYFRWGELHKSAMMTERPVLWPIEARRK